MKSARSIAPLLVAILAFGLLAPAALRAQDKPAAPASPPAASAPAKPDSKDPFGEEVTLTAKPIVYVQGNGKWDSAYETLVTGFKSVHGYLDKAGIKPAGLPMTIYTQTDDTGFQFQAAVPVAEAPKDPPKGDISVGKAPEGKAYKFMHRGSYDSMDVTYEAITNFLDEKSIDAKELFVEQYVTDPVSTPEDKLVVEIYVPVK
jgi:effector-binding domain-containing protein